MPIMLLWNLEAAPFERQVKRWLKELNQYGSLIGKWVGKRLDQAEKVERQTRAFPVVLFYNLSLTARLAPIQRGALLPAGPPGLGESFARIGAAWDLPEAWRVRRAEADLLPRLMRTLAQISGAARGSVARLHDAPSDMFTPGNLSAADLPGLASLTFRAIGQGRHGIKAAALRLHEALFGSGTSVSDGAGTAESGSGGALPLAMRMDNLLRLIAGGLLVVPVLGPLFQKVGQDVILWLKHFVMGHLVAIERKVLDFRQSLLGGINAGLQRFAHVAVGMLVIMRDQATDFLRHYILFTNAYVDGLTQGVTVFFGQLRTFWGGIRGIIRGTMGFLTAISEINLGPLLHAVFVTMEKAIDDLHFLFHGAFGPDKYEAPENAFPVTVGDLVMNENKGPLAHENLQDGITALNAAINEVALRGFYIGELEAYLRDEKGIDIDISGILGRVTELVPRLQQTPRGQPEFPPELVLGAGTMPNVDELFLTPARDAISDGLTAGGQAMRQGAEDLNVTILDFLDSTAITFANAADDAAVSNLRTSIPGLHDAVQQEVMANFPDTELNIWTTGLEPLGQAYADWLVRAAPEAGMQMTGAAVSGYLGFVLDEWERHLAANADTPVAVTETSPRILLERAKLTRVYVPRMVISATGYETDAQLAAAVSGEIRDAVGAAYANGLARMQGYAVTAAAREAAEAAEVQAAKSAPAGAGAAAGGG